VTFIHPSNAIIHEKQVQIIATKDHTRIRVLSTSSALPFETKIQSPVATHSSASLQGPDHREGQRHRVPGSFHWEQPDGGIGRVRHPAARLREGQNSPAHRS
jgi:hypothetical protein